MKLIRAAAALLAPAVMIGCLSHRVPAPEFDAATRDALRDGAIVYIDAGALYRARGDGSGRQQLLSAAHFGPGGRGISAALSRDGRRAACLSLDSIDVRSGTGTALAMHILDLDKDGVTARRRVEMKLLAPPDASGRYPVSAVARGLEWSADGSRLAIGLDAPAGGGVARVLILDDAGIPVADLILDAPGLGAMNAVSWSRDGSWLAVGLERSRAAEGIPDQVVARVDLPATAGRPRGALRVLGAGSYPAVSPDGTRLAVVAPRDGLSDLALLDEAGAEVARFMRPAGKALHHPFWSADGRFLYYYSLASTGPLGLHEVTMLRCLDSRSRQVIDLARLS